MSTYLRCEALHVVAAYLGLDAGEVSPDDDGAVATVGDILAVVERLAGAAP